MSAYGERLREEREKRHLSRAKFCDLAGIPLPTLRNYEMGLRRPSIDSLAALAAVGIDIVYLVTGIRQPNTTAAEQPSCAACCQHPPTITIHIREPREQNREFWATFAKTFGSPGGMS